MLPDVTNGTFIEKSATMCDGHKGGLLFSINKQNLEWNMKKLLTFLALGLFSVSTGALAGTCNGEFGWLGKGKVFGLAEGDFIFTGEFSGAFFNTDVNDPTHKATVQCPGSWHVQGGEGKSQGVCILKDAAGDKMFFTWAGTGSFPVTGGPFQVTGGTGKFEGSAGGGEFMGHTVAMDDQMNGMGYATWTNCTY